jgi:WD40 repeat protein
MATAGAAVAPATELDSPYVGLSVFTEDEAAIFFGREAERATLISNLRAARLTLLYAQSGTGKSSLLRAGVAARLRELAQRGYNERGTARNIPVVFSSWRDEPTDELIAEIDRRIGEFRHAPAPAGNAPRRLEDALARASTVTDATLLVILDQFEEYFLYRSREARDGRFADELASCVNRGDLRANFLISIREDAYSGLGDLFQSRIDNVYGNYLHLENLTAESARQAIEKPIASYNEAHRDERPAEIEPALVDAVLGQLRPDQFMLDQGGKGRLEDLNGAGSHRDEIAAPYLQLVMQRLWEAEPGRDSRKLRLASLQQLGGAQTIVRTHVDRALSNLPADDREAAVDILYHLVTPSGTKIALTAADLAEYTDRPVGPAIALLERLASTETRILRTVPPPHGKDSGIRYEITHDLLAPAILDWGGRQKAARLEHEKAAAEQRTLVERRRARNFRALAAGALAVLAVASVLAFVAFRNESAAQAARHEAESRGLAASAEAALSQNPERATAVALRALRVDNTPQAQAALRAALPQTQLQATLATPPPVRSAVFSADGSKILTAAADGTIRIWDAASHKLLAEFHVFGGGLNSAALSESGDMIVTASDDGAARVLNAHTGKVTAVLQPSDGRALANASFSRNGRLIVTAGADGMARIWNAHTGRQVGAPLVDGENLFDAEFSPDGTRVVTAGFSGDARIWSVKTGKQLGVLRGSFWLSSASFSPNGRHVMTTGGGVARVWDTATDTEVGRATPASRSGYLVFSAAFSPDGRRFLTASTGGSASVWNTENGKLVRVLRTPGSAALQTAAFSPDGRSVVTASANGLIRLWDAATGKQMAFLRGGGSNQLKCAAFSADGMLAATGSRYGTVTIWRKTTSGSGISTWKQVSVIGEPEGDAVNGVAFNKGGNLVATATQSGNVFFFSVPSGAPSGAVFASGNAVNSVQFDPVNPARIVVASDDGLARLYNVRTLKKVGRAFGAKNWPMHDAAFSPDGSRIVTASNDGYARLWDTDDQQQVGAKFGYGYGMTSAMFVGKTKILTTDSNGETIIWDATQGTPDYDSQIKEPGGDIPNDAAVSPDGKVVVTAGTDGTAREWEVSSDTQVLALAGHSAPIQAVAWSGSEVLTASLDGTAKVWDAAPIEQRELLPGPDNTLYTASFSPANAHMIATASSDGAVQIWNTRNRTSAAGQAEPDSIGIASAEFSHNGEMLVTAGYRSDQAKIYSAGNLQQPIGVLDAAKYPMCRNPASATASLMYSATFSRNGAQVVTADADGVACVWDLSTLKPVHAFIEPAGASAGAAGIGGVGGSDLRWAVFSPDDQRVLTASNDGTARIWDVRTGRQLQVMSEPSGEALNDAWFSPNGKFVVTASNDGTTRIWSAATGSLLHVLREPGGSAIYNAAFSPNGRFVVTCSGVDARIWSAKTGQELTEFQYGTTLSDCEFSPGSSEVVTAGADGQTRIFSTQLAGGLSQIKQIARQRVSH